MFIYTACINNLVVAVEITGVTDLLKDLQKFIPADAMPKYSTVATALNGGAVYEYTFFAHTLPHFLTIQKLEK